ncbi:hypothetical protein [Variovorax sp. KK3]|uniref:hypothetical protein n=1 Tax=Variovorax sp. KK3 TaxID=1855728 RepID=UPI00117EDDEF|nr:hypothetical protein [Variovorax sp. KK3]
MFTTFSTPIHSPSPLVGTQTSGQWKLDLMLHLRTNAQARSPGFTKALDAYVLKDKESAMSLLVCELMRHGEDKALTYLLCKLDAASLDLMGTLGEAEFGVLQSAMEKAPRAIGKLQLLDLCLDNAAVGAMLRLLPVMKVLHSLSLEHVEANKMPWFEWRCQDLYPLKNLTVECWSECDIHELLLALVSASDLERLSVKGIPKGLPHKELAAALGSQRALVSLHLGVVVLAGNLKFYVDYLRNSPTLRTLDFSGNRQSREGLDDEEVKILFRTLTGKPLERLSLNQALQSKMRHSIGVLPTLLDLDLSGNRLTDASVVPVILQLIDANVPLRSLKLNECENGPACLDALAVFVMSSKTLENLSIRRLGPLDFFCRGDLDSLAEAVDKSPSLRSLGVSPVLADANFRPTWNKVQQRNEQFKLARIEHGMFEIFDAGGVGDPRSLARRTAESEGASLSMRDARNLRSINRRAAGYAPRPSEGQ